MRISDWSSDVCSSDLEIAAIAATARKAGTEGERRRLKSQLLGAGQALGLLQQAPADWFVRGSSGDDDARIQTLIDARAAAKTTRDFTRAAAIRNQPAAEQVLLEDPPQGVRWTAGHSRRPPPLRTQVDGGGGRPRRWETRTVGDECGR